ncbi:hypothetical protein GCM10009069_30150 [Algimonas arctica]|uniref:Uncharacterized protein n=1 Tax=Algimonas arctica TaxID=1479486 RepID=A0A8J3CTK9_9PROT|nr:hypothetical protein [Algimonas arctica]GHB05776.1 hypothetical protein GCM10009069_30150 [Algimonas arctica]
MAKQIEVSDWAYQTISTLMAEDDTAGSVISRLLASAISPENSTQTIAAHSNELNFHLAAVPDLTFTKIIAVKVNGKTINANKWKSLRDEVIKLGIENGVNMADISSVHTVTGEKSDEGFEFHETLGISIQGQSAKDSWKTCSDICSLIEASVEVLVQWRDNEKAAYPGKKAKLLIP